MGNSARSGAYKRGWEPTDTMPVAVRVEVHATVRNDEPVAVLKLTDVTGETRDVQLTIESAEDALLGIAKFVTQVSRGGRRHL